MAIMISAADAKLQGQGNLVILKEVRAIEEAILTAPELYSWEYKKFKRTKKASIYDR